MKKSFHFLAILSFVTLISVSLSSCSKLVDLFPPFESDIAELPITIPMVVNTENAVETTASMNIKLDSIVKQATANQYSISKVTSIAVKEVRLTLHETDEQNNLANFENVHIKLSSYSNSTPMEIAGASLIEDTYAHTLTLTGDSAKNVKSYLTDSSISFALSTKARRTTSKALNGTLYMTIVVKL